MSKFILRPRVHKFRRRGMSIGKIAETLHISRGTVSLWCKNIYLSAEQKERLRTNMIVGGSTGRLKGAQIQKKKKEQKLRAYEIIGRKFLKELSKRDLLLLGLGLHLGEGAKTENKVKFINSNPLIIKLFIWWIKGSFKISPSRISYRIMINEIHKKREKIVRKKWTKILNAPLAQFKKTVFIRTKSKKIYENYENYLGTLVVTISESSDLQYRILGLEKGLMYKVEK